MLTFLSFIPKRLLFAILCAVAGATAIWGVYLYGKHEGRQQAAVAALQASVNVLRERNQIDDTISASDAASLCADFGLPDDEAAECVRRLAEAPAQP
jgi:hypothetical protein